MRMHYLAPKALGFILALAGLVATNTSATAGVVYYSSQSSFESQGTILSRSDFDSYGTGISVVGAGTVLGDVIINVNPYGVVLGTANTSYPTVKNVVVQPNFASVIVDVVAGPTLFTMLGFKLGNTLGGPSAQVYVVTNLGGYNFNVSATSISSSLTFQGFATTSPNEHIIQFQAYSAPSSGGGAAVTDFELGTVTFVPEPGSLTLLAGICLAPGVVLLRRRLVRQ